MGNCLAKFCCLRTRDNTRRKNEIPLNQRQHKQLKSFFQHIVSNSTVDFSIQEIQDIQDAVHEMLERIRTRVNNRGVFNIIRIVPTGSMSEGTAIWKYYGREPYLEFDYLGVLKESVRQCEGQSDYQICTGCIRIRNPPVKFTLLPQHVLDLIGKRLSKINPTQVCIDKKMINEIFLYEINNCLASSCDCLTLHCERNKFSFEPSSVDNNDGCDTCTVDTPTGTLSVNTNKAVDISLFSVRPNKCSLVLKWTSKTKSLLAPDKLLQQKQPIISVPISEYTHDYFVVPKSCNVCKFDDYKWRKSWCIAEIQAFKTEMSEKHRRCYQITKYHQNLSKPYLIKNVVIQHSITCSDTSDNYVDCVIKVYQDILNANICRIIPTLTYFQRPTLI